MNRRLYIAGTALLLIVITAAVAFAAYLPSDDAYVRAGAAADTNYGDQSVLSLYGSTAACTLTDWSYMKFDLSAVTGEIGRATLALTVAAAPSSIQAGTTVTLYEVAADGWTESTVTASLAPALGPIIQALPAPTANGQIVTFGDASGASPLSDYLRAQALGDKYASVALVLTGTCGAQSSAVRFASTEHASIAAPSLSLYTPTAVTLATSSAETVTWPLYAGLGAVALVVIAGLAVSRRRTA